MRSKPERADVRVITATNKTLSDLVAAGTFRDDLYYRIHVMKLELPPLRDRTEDIPLLVDHFIERFNRLGNKHIVGVTPEAAACLMAHDYPGNVRELENIIEHGFVLCSAAMIDVRHLPTSLHPAGTAEALADKPATLEQMEKGL